MASKRWLDPAGLQPFARRAAAGDFLQPEAAFVSAGRRLRWSRTFPFQRSIFAALQCSGGTVSSAADIYERSSGLSSAPS